MQPNLTQQANDAAARGQSMLSDDLSKASTYRSQYGDYGAQADAANKEVQNYANYMKGEGSAGNQYNTAFQSQLGQLGYDPAQMTAARTNLNQATGALSAYSDFANTGASKWGLNAGGFAAANAGALSGINNNIAANQGVVSSLQDLYKTAQTGANQYTGNVIQGQQTTLAGLQDVYTNASNQRDSARNMMQFFETLAQQQGGLNAQQSQYYAQAQQAYAASSQAMAQANLFAQQAALAKQQLDRTGQLYSNQDAQQAAKAQADAMRSQGLSWNGQTDERGTKIYTGKF